MPTLSKPELVNIAADSIVAFAKQDPVVLDTVMQPIYNGDEADGLNWVICLIEYTTQGMPRRADLPEHLRAAATPQAIVAVVDENTGQRIPLDIDSVPLGIATYARLVVACLSDEPQKAVDLWTAMLRAPADEDGDGSGHMAECMFYGLSMAAAKYRRDATRAAANLQ